MEKLYVLSILEDAGDGDISTEIYLYETQEDAKKAMKNEYEKEFENYKDYIDEDESWIKEDCAYILEDDRELRYEIEEKTIIKGGK